MIPPIFQYTKKQALVEFSKSRIMPTGLPYSFDACPYFEPICDALDDTAGTCRVVLSTPAQCGKSTLIENFVGKMAVFSPAPTLLIMDTATNARAFVTTRLRPFLRNHCKLKCFEPSLPGDEKQKSATQISLGTGASLLCGSSRSAADLCSKPCTHICLDELDRFAVLPGEGDSISLALKRMVRFRGMAFLTSTPTAPDGPITAYWKTGTQQFWGAVCSECGELFDLCWDDIAWDGDTPSAHCPKCGQVYSEDDIKALDHRFSEPANPKPYKDRYGRICRSFAVRAELCHGFYSWRDIRAEQLSAVRVGEGAIRSFVNTTLGRPYIPPTESRFNVDAYAGWLVKYSLSCVPAWVHRVVCGVDTQDNLFAVEAVGFSEDGAKACGLGYHRICGSLDDQAVWLDLVAFVRDFRCHTEDGRDLGIALACIDSGGHYTSSVYSLTVANPRFKAVKGRAYASGGNKDETAIVDRLVSRRAYIGGSRVNVPLVHVGTICAKDRIYANLRAVSMSVSPNDENWLWSNDVALGYDHEYFEELTSNVPIFTAEQHRYTLAEGRHDEALDVRVYAMAAMQLLMQYGGALPAVKAIRSAREAAAQNSKEDQGAAGEKITKKDDVKVDTDRIIDNNNHAGIESMVAPQGPAPDGPARVSKKKRLKPL